MSRTDDDDFWAYLPDASEVRKDRRFEVKLSDRGYGKGVTEDDIIGLQYQRVLRPILQNALRIRLYNLEHDDYDPPRLTRRWRELLAQRDHWLSTYLTRIRGAAEVDLNAAGVFDDVPFWVWLLRGGMRTYVRAVMVLSRARFEAAAFFRNTMEIHSVWNLSASVPPGALAWAKRETGGGRSIALINDATGYPVTLSVVASATVIASLFKSAVRYAAR